MDEHICGSIGIAGTKLLASESNATKRPSALIAGVLLNKLPCSPPVAKLTRVVVCASPTVGIVPPISTSNPSKSPMEKAICCLMDRLLKKKI
jgi:hypothetical protein